MGNGCAGSGGGQGSSAGVGEEVQYFDGTSGRMYLPAEPIPVGGLLRKQACMFEAEGFQMKCQFFIMNAPLLGPPFLLRW